MPISWNIRFVAPKLVLLILVALTGYCYWAGLYGDYVFDDSPNILNNESFRFDALTPEVFWKFMLSGEAGLLKRPISMASFGLNVALWGFDAFYLKLTNLVIHLFNGYLVFLCSRLLITQFARRGQFLTSIAIEWVAVATAGLWLLHPLNLTSVLYIVQRMTSLSALFSLVAIWLYLGGRTLLLDGDKKGWWHLLLWVPLATVLALMSKETGALVAVYVFVIEIFVFRFDARRAIDTRRLRFYFGAALGLPLVAVAMVLVLHPDALLAGYRLRDFTLGERLLTEARVLFFYLRLFLIPEGSQFALYHDDIVISRGLWAPRSTAYALAALPILLIASYLLRHKAPLVAFASFWFFGGHLLESTFLPLEIIHEHRNYLPILGPALVMSYYLLQPGQLRISAYTRIAFMTLLLAFASVTHVRALAWSSLIRHAEFEVRNHPDSERANVQFGRLNSTIYSENNDQRIFDEAEKYYRKAIGKSSMGFSAEVGIIRLYNLAKKVPPEDVMQSVLDKVSRGRQAPLVPVLIQNVMGCNIARLCDLPDEWVLRVMLAFLNNPEIRKADQLNVRMLMAQYLIDKMADGYGATEVVERIVREEPNYLNGRRNLARLYRLSDRLDEAQAEVDAVKRLDKWGVMDAEVREEQKRIDEAKHERAK